MSAVWLVMPQLFTLRSCLEASMLGCKMILSIIYVPTITLVATGHIAHVLGHSTIGRPLHVVGWTNPLRRFILWRTAPKA